MADGATERVSPAQGPASAQQPDSQQQPDQPQTLYRARAYEQRGRVAPIDGVLRVSSPHEWLLLAVLATAVVAVLVWSVFGRLESGVSGPCMLRAAGERHLVTAPSAGVVTEVLAAPGTAVEAGEMLARISAPELHLAAELAAARAAALAAQHPGAPATVAAAAEAEALAALEQADTAVLSPAGGLLAASGLRPGAAVEAGTTLAEVVEADEGPPSAVVSLDDDSARVRSGMSASIALRPAGGTDAVIADARIVAVGAAQPALGVPRPLEATPAVDGAAAAFGAGTAAAELIAPPREFADAAQSGSAYECTARIVTGSHRPIERFVGRR